MRRAVSYLRDTTEGPRRRAVGYLRVSTDEQASEGVSLEAQRARIRAWCAAHEAVLPESEVHVEEGLSGRRSDNRPALQAALDAVCACGGVLVVYSLSRLARSTKDTILIGERLAQAGADLVSLSEQIDTTSAAGKMVFRLLAVLAEFESDLVSERTRAALSFKRSQSERVGQMPYGSILDPDGPRNREGRLIGLLPDPCEQAAIAHILELRSKGLSARRIAADLNARGIPTKLGRGPWIHTAVARILKREYPRILCNGDQKSLGAEDPASG
jgi:DNA invertase Pin-like site-specific DNA recombinase